MKNIKVSLLIFICFFSLFWDFLFAANPFVWNLLWTQLEIWLNQRSNAWTFRNWTVWNSLVFQQEVLNHNKFDLVWELDKCKTEEERLKVLDEYIEWLSTTIANWKSLGDYEQTQIDNYNNAAKECEEPIKSKNSEFSDAVKNYDYEKAESISKEIAELRACVVKNEVYAKAHASYASSSKSLSSLQKRVDYLIENKEKIAKYYEILKPDLLKELYDISKTVENNF